MINKIIKTTTTNNDTINFISISGNIQRENIVLSNYSMDDEDSRATNNSAATVGLSPSSSKKKDEIRAN